MNNLIYESPDGGETVYVREIGDTNHKRLYYKSDRLTKHEQRLKKQQLWNDILLLAETDTVLDQEIERIETWYFVVKDTDE